jgi:hypothetical protein
MRCSAAAFHGGDSLVALLCDSLAKSCLTSSHNLPLSSPLASIGSFIMECEKCKEKNISSACFRKESTSVA